MIGKTTGDGNQDCNHGIDALIEKRHRRSTVIIQTLVKDPNEFREEMGENGDKEKTNL